MGAQHNSHVAKEQALSNASEYHSAGVNFEQDVGTRKEFLYSRKQIATQLQSL